MPWVVRGGCSVFSPRSCSQEESDSSVVTGQQVRSVFRSACFYCGID